MGKRVLQLSKIRLDGNTQSRVELDEGMIQEYQEAYQSNVEMPPIQVMFDGSSYWLWDGFHRRWAADRAGLACLPCIVTDGTREDAQWASYGANASHGLRRSNADKAKAVKAALRHPKGPKCSDRQIAEHVGVDPMTVGKYRKEMESTVGILQSTERTGRDGRTINTAKIGKAALPPSEVKSASVIADDTPDEPVDYGKCPACAGTKWTDDVFGAVCAKCGHVHGEPAGDPDDDQITTQRQKTVKTVEALIRAIDDLHLLLPRPNLHEDAIATVKEVLAVVRGWK